MYLSIVEALTALVASKWKHSRKNQEKSLHLYFYFYSKTKNLKQKITGQTEHIAICSFCFAETAHVTIVHGTNGLVSHTCSKAITRGIVLASLVQN